MKCCSSLAKKYIERFRDIYYEVLRQIPSRTVISAVAGIQKAEKVVKNVVILLTKSNSINFIEN